MIIAYLFGDAEGEHLRIERDGDTVMFISQELRLAGDASLTQWRQRQYIVVSAELLRQALSEIGIAS